MNFDAFIVFSSSPSREMLAENSSFKRSSFQGAEQTSMGFSQAAGEFRDAWPKKDITQEDRRLLEMASIGMGSAELVEFAALLAHRQAQNLG
ncbi:MAG: hypothetical protein WAK98_14665 [Gemmobacter sp.]